MVGVNISHTVDALVSDGDIVAVAWTGTLSSSATYQGLGFDRAMGGLLRSTRHAVIGDLPM
jgi:hypothetical protein